MFGAIDDNGIIGILSPPAWLFRSSDKHGESKIGEVVRHFSL
jgi:hypothetical protein